MILVSLLDVKAETYTPPHPVQNEETAKRELAMLVNSKDKTLISEHPEDFILFAVGEWFERVPEGDKFTAKIVAYPSFRAITNAIDVKIKE